MFTTPPVVKNILIINVLMFFATASLKNMGIDIENYLALYYWGSDKFMPHQLLTHAFMHANFSHIFFNMFAVWMFGRNLEVFWGPKRFLTYYILVAIGAGIIYELYLTYDFSVMNHLLTELQTNPSPVIFSEFVKRYIPVGFDPNLTYQLQTLITDWSRDPNNPMYLESVRPMINDFVNFKLNIPTVGASGAVFGVLMAFGMTFPNTMIMLLFPPIPIKAKYFVLIFGLIELFSGMQHNPTDNVAHFAHLGGMIFGYLLLRYWKNKDNSYY